MKKKPFEMHLKILYRYYTKKKFIMHSIQTNEKGILLAPSYVLHHFAHGQIFVTFNLRETFVRDFFPSSYDLSLAIHADSSDCLTK